jgi:sarcosine oxidase
LRHRTGALDFGVRRDPVRLAARLGAAGVPHTLLTARDAAERWPHLRFGDGPVLHHADAGWLDPDATVAACVARAVAHGADLRTGVRVSAVEQLPSGQVRLHGPGLDRAPVRAERVVVAAGAWLPELGLPARLPPLTVTQHQVFHFRHRRQQQHGSQTPAAAWPVFVHRSGRHQVFGLPSGADGGAASFKLGLLADGRVTTAGTRSGVVDPASRQAVGDYVRERLPELDPEPFAEVSSLRISTPTRDFVLDRSGPLVIVSPCSGHGARFAPLLGRLTADLTLGKAEGLSRFALPGTQVAVRSR